MIDESPAETYAVGPVGAGLGEVSADGRVDIDGNIQRSFIITRAWEFSKAGTKATWLAGQLVVGICLLRWARRTTMLLFQWRVTPEKRVGKIRNFKNGKCPGDGDVSGI